MANDALRRGTLYALCTPLVRIAYRFGLPLKALRGLVELAYFEEHQRRGHTFKETAERLDVSTRKVTQLSQASKALLVDAEQPADLPRKLELMIWSRPMSDRRLSQVLGRAHTAEEIAAALAVLVERRAIELDDEAGVFRPVAGAERGDAAASDDLLGRLDGLQGFIDGVTDLIEARVLGQGAPEADADATGMSFARTHDFSVLPEDVHYLGQVHGLFRLIRDQLEARAARDDRGRQRALSFAMMWSPRSGR